MPTAPNKDSAIVSLVLGVLCFIPLLNWVLSVLAIYFGITALKSIRRDPQQYGGKVSAIVGIAIGVAVLFFNVSGILFFADNAFYPLNVTV